MKQTTFASLSYQSKKKQTRREKFLAEMDQVVPWEELLALIEPHYRGKSQRGRPAMALESMLRIYFMQQWYAMSDPAMEDALYEIESMRRFAGLELIEDAPTSLYQRNVTAATSNVVTSSGQSATVAAPTATSTYTTTTITRTETRLAPEEGGWIGRGEDRVWVPANR